jgi:ribosomal protein S27E
MANRVIEKGFIVEYEHLTAKLFDTTYQTVQCLRCQAWGHIATHCSKGVKCAHCARPHDSRTCEDPRKTKCANCGRGHTAWSRDYSITTAARQKAALARAYAPAKYRTDNKTFTSYA